MHGIVATKTKINLAEREGFEPSVPGGTFDFESKAIVHSATSPGPNSLHKICPVLGHVKF